MDIVVVIVLLLTVFFVLWGFWGKRLKTIMSKFYRLMISPAKREAIVWKDLKKLFQRMEWKHGVFEQEKYIKAGFTINDSEGISFFYSVRNNDFECFTRVIEDFPEEMTSDFFILAQHFNNILNYGMVNIDISRRSVDFVMKEDILVSYLYPGNLYFQFEKHLDIVNDLLYKAFLRLVNENEAPAIIIADVLDELERKKEG